MKFRLLLILASLIAWNVCWAGFGSELASYSFGTSCIVRDKHRDRVYCAVPESNSVAVIDSESLQLIATIFTGSNPASLDVSADGSFLYVANQGSAATGISVINLDTLTVDKTIQTTQGPSGIAIGNGTVYTIEGSNIRAYNADSGTPLAAGLSSIFVYGGLLKATSDGKTLYYYQQGLSPSSWARIDISSWPGSVLQSGQFGSDGRDMALSADEQYISFASGSPYSVNKLQAGNPSVSLGQMDTGPYPYAVTFSPDGNSLFVAHDSGHIDTWNANTYVKTSEISTSGDRYNLECDRTGRVLFAGGSSNLKAYFVGPQTSGTDLKVDINHAVEIRWNSQAGSLYQVQWKRVLSGSEWYDLGGQVVGNGLTMSVFDTTRDNRAKFYRVELVSP